MMRSVRTWGPIGRPDTRDAGGSNEGGRRGSDDGSHWPSRMGSHWPSLDSRRLRSRAVGEEPVGEDLVPLRTRDITQRFVPR